MDVTDANPASKKVLAISELLENILSHLPLKDVLHAQQIYRQWHNLITHSIVLLRQSFLEPVTRESCKLMRLTPALMDGLQDWIAWPGERIILQPREKYPKLRRYVMLNPLVSHAVIPRRELRRLPWTCQIEYRDVKRMLSWHKGQWEETFITQPPTKKLLFSSSGGSSDATMIEGPVGIRLGAVVKP